MEARIVGKNTVKKAIKARLQKVTESHSSASSSSSSSSSDSSSSSSSPSSALPPPLSFPSFLLGVPDNVSVSPNVNGIALVGWPGQSVSFNPDQFN